MSCQNFKKSQQRQSKPAATINPGLQSWEWCTSLGQQIRKLAKSSLQERLNKKESKRQQGLIYSHKSYRSFSFDKDQYVEKSFKINCSELASIVAHLQDLNFKYLPQRKGDIISPIIKLCFWTNQFLLKRELPKYQPFDVRLSKEWQDSWDVIQYRKKNKDKLWKLILLINLLCIVCKTIRQSFFVIQSSARQLVWYCSYYASANH